ncbi:sigma-70 family RNA polymerase sigma factor [Saccharopolyspora hordei]|uniref:RNA polymerase sigma factor n=1 Tax=Saccharopolyspora hordei TaxID=1838 RepID=A0A853AQ39_9PSEU|nr:sigma-70 family RNA polymerase sigma factor [Saccharopolyspora hordei]NYI84813.1 RNA polymerase sigma-70 factor (ECF subfamily) [Saccharopolyspora hordei]
MNRSAADDARLTDLAFAAGRGDRAALEAFVRATQRDVWCFLAHLADVGSADDLAQETYLRAMRSLSRFEGRASARTWLLSIARRVAADRVRHERARPVSPVDVAAVDRPQRGRFEEVVELTVMLDDLAPERREALLLTQVLGLSYQETAEVCGCAVGTVRSRVARAREDLLGERRGRSEEAG